MRAAGPSECAQYAGNEATWSLCIADGARIISAVAEARTRCDLAGVFDKECESSWIGSAMRRGTPVEDILGFCRDDECRLLVLDASGLPWPERLPICREAGRFAEDCARHVLQDWKEAEPSLEDVEVLMAVDRGYPKSVGDWSELALVQLGLDCDSVVDTATPANLESCRIAARSR